MNRERPYKAVLLIFLAAALLPSATRAADVVGSVREVIDGDTVLLQDGQKVR